MTAHWKEVHDNLLDVGIHASRTRLAVFEASPRTVRRSIRPLYPVVLVTTELLGVAAEIAGVCLLRSHFDGPDGWLAWPVRAVLWRGVGEERVGKW